MPVDGTTLTAPIRENVSKACRIAQCFFLISLQICNHLLPNLGPYPVYLKLMFHGFPPCFLFLLLAIIVTLPNFSGAFVAIFFLLLVLGVPIALAAPGTILLCRNNTICVAISSGSIVMVHLQLNLTISAN